MAAPAKTIHTFKPVEAERPALREARPTEQYDDRRRMNVSEKLAEGRGFWRGAFVGASVGAVAGMAGSVGVADMWTKQVLETVQASAAISSVFGENADLRDVHRAAPEQPAGEVLPAGPSAGGAAR
jgi:hypothetical protein